MNHYVGIGTTSVRSFGFDKLSNSSDVSQGEKIPWKALPHLPMVCFFLVVARPLVEKVLPSAIDPASCEFFGSGSGFAGCSSKKFPVVAIPRPPLGPVFVAIAAALPATRPGPEF